MTSRDACIADFPQVLMLNQQSVHFLSPLTPDRLAALHGMAAYHRVIEINGTISAFLLAFREGAVYDSPNYLWFNERYADFLYIDRVVVSEHHQGQGLGRVLYEDLFAFAVPNQAPIITCEYDIEPPNPGSMAFHARLGFHEVGRQSVADGKKWVSLQARATAARVTV